jgi:hypothetical protein
VTTSQNADNGPVLDVEGREVLVRDRSPLVHLVGPVFALFALILVPWIVYLAFSLPSRQDSPHYDVAWVGFDALECVALASTAYFALRRSMFLSTAASATAVLLVVDAWFDCLTSPAAQLPESIALCFLVELPLAAVCLWLSYHTVHIVERQIILLRRRRRG